ncbi:MAG: Hsp20/alpha crystallin family protein [Deltaproteobacteria bacterium]|nr:MAG: Hsp20/alpha crystallin family protein [Deltaproteobacteria bacterium]
MAKQTAIESPPVNVYEANDQLTVAIPVPGAHHDTTEVRLDGETLTIRAEARYPQEQQHYLQHEWSVGSSHRQIKLPRPVRASGAKAMLTRGAVDRRRATPPDPFAADDPGRAGLCLDLRHRPARSPILVDRRHHAAGPVLGECPQ